MRFAIRAAIALVVLAVLAGGAYAAYWFAAANKMQSALAEWAAAPGPGTTVTMGDVTVSGFPTQLIATVPHIEVARSGDALGLGYSGDDVRLARPLQGGNIVVSVRGAQSVRYRDGTVARALSVKTDSTTLEVRKIGRAHV